MHHLLSVLDLKIETVLDLLSRATDMKTLVKTFGGADRLKHKIMTTLFYEPSTRTSCSFRAAMLRLGGSVIDVNVDQSSIQKGETIEDTIQTLSCYSDVIVMRHPQKNVVPDSARFSTVPVINAGDGTGEHPTQALLDLYTIYSELGAIGYVKDTDTPMKITMVGDLKHSRTVHSLIKLLCMFSGIEIRYVSPEGLSVPYEIYQYAKTHDMIQVDSMELKEAIRDTDVLYVMRIQKERFVDMTEYDSVKDTYCVNARMMESAKKQMIIMHPLPRTGELSSDLDEDPRAAYFRQMENGMYMRMAILERIMNGSTGMV
jgi:aspartate carbamoyltransferase|uniref:aspartate carbamoyltransferase n=1 Tax=viral metagenome TaxID=1070528 RepID=A0A6C0DYS6_9ZZZZ